MLRDFFFDVFDAVETLSARLNEAWDVYVTLKLEIKRKVWSHSLVLRADIWTEVFSDLSRLTKERQNGICLNFLKKNW